MKNRTQAMRRQRVTDGPASTSVGRPMSAASAAPAHVEARLFPAVIKEFSHKLFKDVNIRDISRISGVSSATIYKYYASKEGLIIRVLDHALDGLAERVTGAIDSASRYSDKWRNLIRTVMRWYDDNAAVAVVVNVSLPPEVWFRPRQQWPLTAVPEVMRDLVRLGRQLGELDDSIRDSQILAFHFMLTRHEINYWFSERQRWRLESRVDLVFPLFWKAVSMPAAKQPSRSSCKRGGNVSSSGARSRA